MNRKLFLVTIFLPLTILGVILSGQILPQAHATGSGMVCIAQVTDTGCPPAGSGVPPIFNGPVTTPNSLLRVPIFINNTDPFLGFDITVNSSDVTKLKPFGADLAGSMMPTGSVVLSECIGTFNATGGTCPSSSNPTNLRFAVIGPFGFLSPQGASGLLFNAIFQIVGTTLPGGITVDFQSGCTNTSTADKCVVITNGTIAPVTESTRNAGFDNSAATLPYATLSTSSTNLGAFLAGAPTHALPAVTYTAAAQNGFDTSGSSTLTLAVSFNGTGAKPIATLTPSSIDLTGIASQTFTQTGTVSAVVKAGRYNATVTATYTSQDPITLTTNSLSAAYSLRVNITDFVLTTDLSTVTVSPGGSQPVIVTITPKASFNTLVKLGLTVPSAAASAGIGGTYSTSTISGGSGTSTLTVTATSSASAGTYTLTVTSNSTLGGFTKIHTTILTVKVPAFALSATAASTFTGGPLTSTITVSYSNGFTGTVTLTNNTITNLSCTTTTPTPNSFTANGTATISCTSNIVGTYHLSVTGTSGSIVRSTLANFTFTAGFSISATSPSHAVGFTMSSTIAVTFVKGFSGTVNLSNSTLANLTCGNITPTTTFTGNGTANISCSSSTIGVYPLIITATLSGGSVSTTATATFSFTTPFAIVASSPPSQNLGTAETSTISVSLWNGFTGTVDLTNNTQTNLVCQTIVQPSFTANGTTTISCLSNVPGSYVLTISGTSSISGTFTATGMATFTFAALTHDVAITGTPSISPSGQVNVGTPITVSFTLENKSPSSEQVTVSLLVGTLTVDAKNVTLSGNQSQSVTLNWNTTGYGANTYNLSVKVQLPAGETNVESGSQVLAQQVGSSTLQSTATTPLLDSTTVAIIAVIIIAAAVLGTLLLLRRRRTTTTTAQPGTL